MGNAKRRMMVFWYFPCAIYLDKNEAKKVESRHGIVWMVLGVFMDWFVVHNGFRLSACSLFAHHNHIFRLYRNHVVPDGLHHNKNGHGKGFL
jgi:hypothetical protein